MLGVNTGTVTSAKEMEGATTDNQENDYGMISELNYDDGNDSQAVVDAEN